MKVDGARLGNALVATIFIAGFCTSLIGALAVRTFHEYYRRTVHRRAVYEELLGLTEARDLPNGVRANLAIGTTDSDSERHQILTRTEDWIHRPLKNFSVVGGFRLTLSILAVLHLLGAAAAIGLALGQKP